MSNKNTKKTVSIICPVFNEEDSIPIFYERLQTTIKPLREVYDFELVFTNNRSTDRSLEIINNICENDATVNVLTLSRNFGYQKSMLAGLSHSNGDVIIVIDVDCEDPPEMVQQFLKYWEQGYDIVYGLRDRREEPKIIELFRKLFYRLLKIISDNESIVDMAEFSLFTRRVRDVIISNQSTYPFIRNEIAYVGLKQKGIRYNREKRAAGNTHYNLINMMQFAIAGILSASTFPLRLTSYIALPLFLINLIFMILSIFGYIKISMTAIIVIDLMFLIFSVTFVSIYLARIYHDIIARPKYIIDWEHSIVNSHNLEIIE